MGHVIAADAVASGAQPWLLEGGEPGTSEVEPCVVGTLGLRGGSWGRWRWYQAKARPPETGSGGGGRALEDRAGGTGGALRP